MIIGVKKEIKEEEHRVAVIPSGVEQMHACGHEVFVEIDAGIGSGFSNEDYEKADAIISTAEEIWQKSEMIMKVKEPQKSEYKYLKSGQILFTFLHLAVFPELVEVLQKNNVTAIDYATVESPDGVQIILKDMSEIAGRLAIQKGMQYLEKINGGKGILLNCKYGQPANVLILGGGSAGASAAKTAAQLESRVSLIETNPKRRSFLYKSLCCEFLNLNCLEYNPKTIEKMMETTDLLVGAVLLKDKSTPKVVSREMVKKMAPGSVIVDISIDEGGCVETSRPTTHKNPTFIKHGVIHYGVTNMPGIVPRTSTLALAESSLPFALEIANKGITKALKKNPGLLKGVNVYGGEITNKKIAETFGKKYFEIF